MQCHLISEVFEHAVTAVATILQNPQWPTYTAQKDQNFNPQSALAQINDPTEGHVYADWCTEFFKGHV